MDTECLERITGECFLVEVEHSDAVTGIVQCLYNCAICQILNCTVYCNVTNYNKCCYRMYHQTENYSLHFC